MSDEPVAENGRELELLAVLDRFAREVEDGTEPRLSTYLRTYPQFAAELTDFASGYVVDAQLAAVAAAADAGEVRSGQAHELSAGSRRALAALFPEVASGGQHAPAKAPPAHLMGETGGLRLVAERRGDYTASRQGLVGLAAQHGVSLDQLAALVDLPVDALLWLDAQGMESLPNAAQEFIAGALDIGLDAVKDAALTRGAPSPSATELAGGLLAQPGLTAEQRKHWAKLLRGSNRDGR